MHNICFLGVLRTEPSPRASAQGACSRLFKDRIPSGLSPRILRSTIQSKMVVMFAGYHSCIIQSEPGVPKCPNTNDVQELQASSRDSRKTILLPQAKQPHPVSVCCTANGRTRDIHRGRRQGLHSSPIIPSTSRIQTSLNTQRHHPPPGHAQLQPLRRGPHMRRPRRRRLHRKRAGAPLRAARRPSAASSRSIAVGPCETRRGGHGPIQKAMGGYRISSDGRLSHQQ